MGSGEHPPHALDEFPDVLHRVPHVPGRHSALRSVVQGAGNVPQSPQLGVAPGDLVDIAPQIPHGS